MKPIRNIWLLLTVLLVTSCGELFNLNVNDADAPDGVMMTHHDIDVMVGDSVFFDAKAYPDSVVVSYRWKLLGDVHVGKLEGNWFHATAAGELQLQVEAENIDLIDDSIFTVKDVCNIVVFEWSEGVEQGEYLYETIVYASLEIDDIDLTNSIDGLQVAAVVNGEVRALAEMKEAYGVNYLQLRIGSYWPGEKATLECYHPGLHERFVFQEITLNGSTYGRLSDLVKLVGYSKD